jgi:hypothetical protein
MPAAIVSVPKQFIEKSISLLSASTVVCRRFENGKKILGLIKVQKKLSFERTKNVSCQMNGISGRMPISDKSARIGSLLFMRDLGTVYALFKQPYTG